MRSAIEQLLLDEPCIILVGGEQAQALMERLKRAAIESHREKGTDRWPS